MQLMANMASDDLVAVLHSLSPIALARVQHAVESATEAMGSAVHPQQRNSILSRVPGGGAEGGPRDRQRSQQLGLSEGSRRSSVHRRASVLQRRGPVSRGCLSRSHVSPLQSYVIVLHLLAPLA